MPGSPSSLENTETEILPETSSTEFDTLIPEATVTSIPATPENIEDENMEIPSPISPVVTPIAPGIE
ncbi:MAG: hypothetical protein PHQ95_01935 [Candidatus Gracilibacteria bacterium]|nr:hypothetical protein [Candidatus Gracilibacteria bacterium]